MKNKLKLAIIFAVFIAVNLIFNSSIWKELFGSKLMISDNVITEFIVENSYQNILDLKNPFITDSILYPFRTNLSLNDPANSYTFLFFILRPFLDPHKIMLIVVILSFFLNNVIMYWLLKKLKVSDYVALLVALIFGFTPYLSHRVMGHYTYIPIYLFPLGLLIAYNFFTADNTKSKLFLSVAFGLFLGLVVLSNFYYFFMILMAAFFYLLYVFIYQRAALYEQIRKNYAFVFTSILTFFLSLLPWLISVVSLVKNQGLAKTPGFGGAIELSADLLSFIIPSEFNPFYKKIMSSLPLTISPFIKLRKFFFDSWERFAYPGIFIVVTYLVVSYYKYKKRISYSLWKKIRPFFLISLIFAVLMLGPFLKAFNRWMYVLDGIPVVIPLPYLVLHYLPGLNTMRASARFTPFFVFLASIVLAYCLDYALTKIGKNRKQVLLFGIFLIFIFDQFYVIPTKNTSEIPENIYKHIKNQKNKYTVLEIPFTVRDGFKYIGFVHAIQPMVGQIVHGKPIIGGYLARVPDGIFDYYRNLKFIGYIGQVIDKGNYDPLKEKPLEPKVYPYPHDIGSVERELKSLNVGYIVLKEDEKYSSDIREVINKAGYKKILTDNQYGLYEN